MGRLLPIFIGVPARIQTRGSHRILDFSSMFFAKIIPKSIPKTDGLGGAIHIL
jgi:hypothetical protein